MSCLPSKCQQKGERCRMRDEAQTHEQNNMTPSSAKKPYYSIRQAVADDAYTFARMRQAMQGEMNPGKPIDATLREQLFVYWYEMFAGDAAVGWLAEVNDEPIGMVTVLVHLHPPRPNDAGRRGYVTGMYVVPQHRQNGIGRALMQAAIDWGHAQGLQRLELHSSDQGRPLYGSLGFAPREFLRLDL